MSFTGPAALIAPTFRKIEARLAEFSPAINLREVRQGRGSVGAYQLGGMPKWVLGVKTKRFLRGTISAMPAIPTVS